MSKDTILNFEDIVGKLRMVKNVIITPDRRFVSVVEISPINFDYKTSLDREKIIDAFARFTKVCPATIQIKSLSRKADTNKYINVLNKDFAKETNANLKRNQDDYINLIKRLGVYSGLSRRFFIVFQLNDSSGIKNDEDAVYAIDKAKHNIRRFISSCGNAVIQHEDESEFVLSTFYEFANKNKTLFDFRKRKEEIMRNLENICENDEELIESFEMPIAKLISPEKIEFFDEYCIVNDTYYSFLYIPSKEYPYAVPPAWLSGIICGGEGIDVDFYVDRQDTKVMKSRIRNKMRINKARINTMHSTEGENFEELGNSLHSTSFIKQKLSEGEDFFFLNTFFTVSASSLEDLYDKMSLVKETFSSIDTELNECQYKIKEAFVSYLPLNSLDPSLFSRSKRNITTSGLSAFYPFNSFEVSDTDGILFGISENKTMIVVNNFDTSKYSNANITILGTSGAGKTFTLQTLCMRFRLKGIQTFIIAPIKGDEFEKSCTSLGGEFVTISSGSKSRINIMEIRPFDETELIKAGFSSRKDRQSVLSEKIDSLLTFFSLAIGEMSTEERTFLDEAILKTYEGKGITKENSSLVLSQTEELDENNHIVTKVKYKEMPIIEDLYNVLKKQPETQRLANVLARYVTGSASAFNGATNVDLSNKYIVFDLTDLSKELKPLGMFVALDYIWDITKQNKIKKKVIAIDEAWMLLNENPLAAEFVLQIFKTIRGMGGCAIAATQDVEDFFALDDGKYGKAVINNSRIKMMLKLEEKEADIVQKHFNLSYSELKTITGFHRGQVLVTSNENTFAVDFKASRLETLTVTTDNKLLNKIANGEIITGDDLSA